MNKTTHNISCYPFEIKKEKSKYLKCSIKGYVRYAEVNLGNLASGLNKFLVKLKRGGSIEVRVASKEGQPINDFEALIYFKDRLNKYPLFFDIKKNAFIIADTPIGYLGIFFKAKGYHNTPTYSIRVVPDQSCALDIQFELPRVITFEIDKPNIPSSINGFIRLVKSMTEFSSIISPLIFIRSLKSFR